MKIIKLSREEYKKRFGDTGAFTERYKGAEPVVYIPGRASTKEVLHEIYHATRSPDLERIEKGEEFYSAEEQALEEVRAQQFAAEGIGKEGILWNQLESPVLVLIDHGYKPNTILNSIVKALREEGYEVDDSTKSTLWWYIKEKYAERKSRG